MNWRTLLPQTHIELRQSCSTDDRSPEHSLLSRKDLIIAGLLGALAFALFSLSIGYDFVNFDDDLYVYNNPGVLNGLSTSGLKYDLTSNAAGTWAPLTWLSYQLDTTVLGFRASSYHLTNVLLHSAAGALLFLALQMMVRSLWVSTVVSAVFLFHPLRIESVVWIAERKDVLCAFFWMLGLVAYAWYAKKPSANRWALLFACFVAGLMSKMMMVTFPFVLLLLDVWPLSRLKFDPSALLRVSWPAVREKLPLFLMSVVAVWVNSLALNSVHTLAPVSGGLATRLLQVPQNYIFYLQKLLWPASLSVLYPIRTPSPAAGILCLLLICSTTVLVLRYSRSKPFLPVGWFWFLGVLVPVIGLVRFSDFAVADRYTYIPSVGASLALAVLVEGWTKRFPFWQWSIAGTVGCACALLTISELPVWQNSLTLYDAALRNGPHHVAYNNRGMAYFQAGDAQRAFEDFSNAILANPNFARAYVNRASLLITARRYDEAARDCNRAIECDPTLISAYNNRANAEAGAGSLTAALNDYDHCIRLSPSTASYFNNRAAAYFRLGRTSEALADIKRCRALGGEPQAALVEALLAVQNVQTDTQAIADQAGQVPPQSQ